MTRPSVETTARFLQLLDADGRDTFHVRDYGNWLLEQDVPKAKPSDKRYLSDRYRQRATRYLQEYWDAQQDEEAGLTYWINCEGHGRDARWTLRWAVEPDVKGVTRSRLTKEVYVKFTNSLQRSVFSLMREFYTPEEYQSRVDEILLGIEQLADTISQATAGGEGSS